MFVQRDSLLSVHEFQHCYTEMPGRNGHFVSHRGILSIRMFKRIWTT